jgi:hypothetical protein
MDHRVVLPLRGIVLTTRLLTNGEQVFLLVIERVRSRIILGIYGWGVGNVFVAEFLMGLERIPEGIDAIHGEIREVGRALRQGDFYLIMEDRGDTTWYIIYDHEDGEWVIDEEMTELVIAPEGREVFDDE